MPNPFIRGRQVYLAPIDASDEQVAANARWVNDPEVTGHLILGRFPISLHQERSIVESFGNSPNDVHLGVFLAQDDRYIGNCGLHAISWAARRAEAGIFIGERELWGKGYGTEALGLLLRHAFTRLNLHRVGLNVYAENERAIRSYRRLGFVEEGRLRQWAWHDEGRYRDALVMSLLAPEWWERHGRG